MASVTDTLGIPSNLRRIYLPFVPNNNPGYFTFKEGQLGSANVITPFSKNLAKLIAGDSGIQLTHDQTQANLVLQRLLKYIPAVQIREYMPDPKLTQLFKWIDAFRAGWKAGKEAASEINAETFSLDQVFSGLQSLRDQINIKFQELTMDSALGLQTVFGGIGPENYKDMNFPVGKDAGYAVLYAPFILYYRLNTTTTTNVYEIPFDINVSHNDLMHSDGTYGWGGGDAFSSGSLAAFGNRDQSTFSKILGLNTIKTNMMPSFNPDGTQQGLNFTIEFTLINDTAEGAANNFIMLHNLFGNNRWIQYGFVQAPASLYDVKIPGANRYFMCKGQFTCSAIGGFRTPSNLLCNKIVASTSHDRGGEKGKDWYPNSKTALETQAESGSLSAKDALASISQSGRNGDEASDVIRHELDRYMEYATDEERSGLETATGVLSELEGDLATTNRVIEGSIESLGLGPNPNPEEVRHIQETSDAEYARLEGELSEAEQMSGWGAAASRAQGLLAQSSEIESTSAAIKEYPGDNYAEQTANYIDSQVETLGITRYEADGFTPTPEFQRLMNSIPPEDPSMMTLNLRSQAREALTNVGLTFGTTTEGTTDYSVITVKDNTSGYFGGMSVHEIENGLAFPDGFTETVNSTKTRLSDEQTDHLARAMDAGVLLRSLDTRNTLTGSIETQRGIVDSLQTSVRTRVENQFRAAGYDPDPNSENFGERSSRVANQQIHSDASVAEQARLEYQRLLTEHYQRGVQRRIKRDGLSSGKDALGRDDPGPLPSDATPELRAARNAYDSATTTAATNRNLASDSAFRMEQAIPGYEDRINSSLTGSSLTSTSGDLDSSGNIFVQREYFKIPDAYKVRLVFTSLLPDNFNNFLFGFRNDNLDPVEHYIKGKKIVDHSVFEEVFEKLKGFMQ